MLIVQCRPDTCVVMFCSLKTNGIIQVGDTNCCPLFYFCTSLYKATVSVRILTMF